MILTPLAAPFSPKRNKSLELRFHKNLPIAAPLLHHFTPLVSPLLHYFIPSQQITPYSYISLPQLEALTLHCFRPPYLHPISGHSCIAILTGVISRTSPIAAHSSPTITSKFWPGEIPQISSHCSPLQLIITSEILQGAVVPRKFFHRSPFQPTLASQFCSGDNSSRSSHCRSAFTSSYHSDENTLHPYINLPPPPAVKVLALLQQNGRILGRRFDPGHHLEGSQKVL